MAQPGRNDPCPCGSGKKFKKCCLDAQAEPAGGVPDLLGAGEPGVYFDEIDRVSNRVPALIREGRLDEAEAVCQRLLEEFPDHPDGQERQAEVEEARGNWKRAAELYRAVAAFHLRADPEYGDEPAQHYLAKARELEAGRDAAAPERRGGDTPGR